MNKLEFINALGEKLSSLPPREVNGILDYYVESIDDRMEDGMTESDAIDALGDLEELAAKILSEQAPLQPPQAPEPPEMGSPSPAVPPKKRRMSPGVIVLLVLGSPIWLSLAVAAFAVILSLYVTIWALLGTLAVVAGALILSGLVGAVASFFAAVTPGTIAMRLLCCGGCLVCGGLGLALLPASLWLIRGFARLHILVCRKILARKEASR